MTSRVLVVGGTGGIGQAIVERFVADGSSVVFTYLRAEQSALDIRARSLARSQVEARQLDVRDTEKLTDLLASCKDELQTIVFACASSVNRPLAELRRKHVDWAFDVNVKSFILMVGAALPILSPTRGSIVVLTSVGSRRVMPDYGLVGASKAALETVVRYAAVECAEYGVRVNAVCSGLVMTKALDGFPAGGGRLVERAGTTPMGRLARPEDVADAVAWLASGDASMVTGHTLVVDGGFELL